MHKNQLQIPRIARARAYRLYDYKGNRLIDMYQNNGHAILGHRAGLLTKTMKNVIARGQIFNMPSVYTARLKKFLAVLFPGYKSFRIYSSRALLLQAASAALKHELTLSGIVDPALTGNQAAEIAYWRPFTESAGDEQPVQVPLLVPILPFLAADAPRILCFRDKREPDFFPSSVISPFILAATLRALYDLQKYQIPQWGLADCLQNTGWQIKSIYISACCDEDKYEDLFRIFLSAGVLLSPKYPGPSLLPAEVSPGEIKKIRKLFEINPGV